MEYQHYFKESDEYMRSLLMCMDNAHSVEKMFDWSNLGGDNAAWKEAPYITTLLGGKPIPRDEPITMRISNSHSRLLGYQFDATENGKRKLGHRNESIPANKIIPTVSVMMQFSLLEAYDHTEFLRYKDREALEETKQIRRYDRKPVAERLEIIQKVTGLQLAETLFNAYQSLSNLRNLLTHEPSYLCNSAHTAVEYYMTCQAVAYKISTTLGAGSNSPETKRRTQIWDDILSQHVKIMEF